MSSVSDLQDRRLFLAFPPLAVSGQRMRAGFSVSDVQDPCFKVNYPLDGGVRVEKVSNLWGEGPLYCFILHALGRVSVGRTTILASSGLCFCLNYSDGERL